MLFRVWEWKKARCEEELAASSRTAFVSHLSAEEGTWRQTWRSLISGPSTKVSPCECVSEDSGEGEEMKYWSILSTVLT